MKSRRKREAMYEQFGPAYEQARYGDPYKELYRHMRNEVLLGIVKSAVRAGSPCRVLELGCGTGLTLRFLSSELKNVEIFGMDFSDAMLSQANEKRRADGAPFCLARGDTFKLPFRDAGFDVVYSTRFIHQFSHDEKRRIFSEINRVLVPGGASATEFYTPHGALSRRLRGVMETPAPHQCPTICEIRDLLGRNIALRPVRMMGTRAIARLFGEDVLHQLTSLTRFAPLRVLAEEYFVVACKR